jgi:hypothetical protein
MPAICTKGVLQKKKKMAATLVVSAAAYAAILHFQQNQRKIPRPMHTSILTGRIWLDEILHGHPDRFKNQLGMSQAVFRRLSRVLQLQCGLTDSKFIAADEQLAMFLYFVRRGCSVRDLMERFQHSPDTVHRYAFSCCAP